MAGDESVLKRARNSFSINQKMMLVVEKLLGSEGQQTWGSARVQAAIRRLLPVASASIQRHGWNYFSTQHHEMSKIRTQSVKSTAATVIIF